LRDESGFYPLPRVVRTDAPVGHIPIVEEWGTRAHLSASRAISREGQRDVRRQDCARNAAAVVGLREPLRREGPGRMLIIGDGAPIPRSPTIREVLTNGASHRLPLERLPA
jgi:hypothetical protein